MYTVVNSISYQYKFFHDCIKNVKGYVKIKRLCVENINNESDQNCISTLFDRVFQRKNPFIEKVKLAGGRLPKGNPYCTDNSSCIFQVRKCLLCNSIVLISEMCILLRF